MPFSQIRCSSTPYVNRTLLSSLRPPKFARCLVPVRMQAASNDQPDVIKFDLDEIDSAKDALNLGLGLCSESRWNEALAIFEKALTLPGTGLKRFRDKPPMLSDGEKMATYYNMACCHSRMNDIRTGLVSLSGCLEAGYEDFKQIRTDPDLENLRSDPRFETLLTRFEPKKKTGLFGLF